MKTNEPKQAAQKPVTTPLVLAIEDRYRIFPLHHDGPVSRELMLANRYPVRL